MITPVDASVTLVEQGDDRFVSEVPISADEQVFAGHYPRFPIFPGVCVVECVNLSVRAALPGLALTGIESTRFQSPVFPGDTIRVEATWVADGPNRTVRAQASTARGKAASVKLRYRVLEES